MVQRTTFERSPGPVEHILGLTPLNKYKPYIFVFPRKRLPITTVCTFKDTNWVYPLVEVRVAGSDQPLTKFCSWSSVIVFHWIWCYPRDRNNFRKRSCSPEFREKIKTQAALLTNYGCLIKCGAYIVK
ncbi:uncharacterized protein LOC119589714 [Penaeus monodon]|uniref:uncharacterized protein LOC119589714 n=1 Tax=Penaeus monodon TaxID=6687 RepID=UPI0018A74E87|nr:uncharacterized protein LOC119589714 [Penaeus monodon]